MQEYKGPVENSIEIAAERIEDSLSGDYAIAKRALALLLLQDDQEIKELVRRKDPQSLDQIETIITAAKEHLANPVSYELALERQDQVNEIADKVVSLAKEKTSLPERLSRLTMNPFTGLPILFLVLYLGLYKFVGQFGAGSVVDFLETFLFKERINPFLIDVFTKIIPWQSVSDLFIGEYGMLTLGLRYALAIILPIVTFFFIFFSIIEDSGYLPRLAMLIDRSFKRLGLSGWAVIPMVLGFGCTTMATMVTRTLPTKRERIIATMLLSLAVPCSAQLGVIVALLQANTKALLIWAGAIGFIFLFIGQLTARLMPGERPSFYMELPPLRLPKVSNILVKTYVRVKWYFKEILPLFLGASFLIWLGRLSGLFDLLIKILEKPVTLVGLPAEASKVFLFGFFRRDYGAAGLYDLNQSGQINGNQLLIACIALTLFLPCVAQLLMNIKERGLKTALGISLFVLFSSFSAAFILNFILTGLRINL